MPEQNFKLLGSIGSELSDEELEAALAELREEQRKLSDAKIETLGSD